MIDHCRAMWLKELEEKAYKVYTTDSLRITSENTAKFAGGGYIKERWADIMEPKPKDSRTGEQIAADVIKKAGLKLNTRSKKAER